MMKCTICRQEATHVRENIMFNTVFYVCEDHRYYSTVEQPVLAYCNIEMEIDKYFIYKVMGT